MLVQIASGDFEFLMMLTMFRNAMFTPSLRKKIFKGTCLVSSVLVKPRYEELLLSVEVLLDKYSDDVPAAH